MLAWNSNPEDELPATEGAVTAAEEAVLRVTITESGSGVLTVLMQWALDWHRVSEAASSPPT